MTQSSFLDSESCPKHLKLLYYIGTGCVHRSKPVPEHQSNDPHQKFDLVKSQVLLLPPVVLKFLLLLSNNTSKAGEAQFLEPLRLIEVNCLG